MLKSLLFRWSMIRQIRKECVLQLAELKKNPFHEPLRLRQLSVSVACCKKRKSVEEKAVENQGRRVIRYSPKAGSEVVGIWRNMTVQDIADVLNKDVEHILRALEFADKTPGAQYSADSVVRSQQVARDVVKICGARFRLVPRPDHDQLQDENRDAFPQPPAPAAALAPRPCVACVMGHVDHGKTTLLDALRDSSLVDREFGGITQHIGAFEVKLPSGERMTFLDTPGHAAFSAMRARGAGATDLVVLVVAADDGVMPQTVESIRMAREADVPILVAINKIDKPGVNIERTLHGLASHGVVCEALGGGVQAVPVAALSRANLPALLEALLLQAQMMDLKADPTGLVEGVVLDARLDPRTGKQATVLVQRGTLRRGAVLVAGNAWGKVRALVSAEGGPLGEAGPSSPCVAQGWRELPAAGDQVLEVASERRAAEVMRARHAARMRERQEADQPAISLKEDQHRQQYRAELDRRRAMGRRRARPQGPRQKMLAEDDHPTLSLLVKGDVDGSVEAIVDLLETYDEHERVRLDLVHAAVGPVTPSDLELAEAFGATVVAFNVECPAGVAAEARARGVPVEHLNVVYRLVDFVKRELGARIPPTFREEQLGEANVGAAFTVSEGRRRVPVAGCRCTKGALRRDALYRLLRDGETVYEGKLASMKHLKDEVTTVKRDTECGLRFEDPSVEARPGDTVVCYRLVEDGAASGWDPGF